MGLETELDDNKSKSNSVENFATTGAGLIGAGLGAIVSYNFAGAFATASDFSDNSDKWITAGILSTGTIAGSIVGAYAFAEMAAKKQYERLFTTASALGGITATGYGLEKLNPDINGLWPVLGLYTLAGAAAGALGNLLYNLGKKGISKIKSYEIKIIPKEKDK